MRALYAVIGAGGQGRNTMGDAESDPFHDPTMGTVEHELLFVVDGRPADQPLAVTSAEGVTVNGRRVISKAEFMAYEGRKFFSVAINDYEARRRLATELSGIGCKPFTVRALTAITATSSTIGEGAILSDYCVLKANAKVGKFFHGYVLSHVGHDAIVGDFVTAAPKAAILGSVVIEDDVFIGSGATIMQSMPDKPIVIGKGAVIGMGAVVTRSVAPHEVVAGVPAKPLRKTV